MKKTKIIAAVVLSAAICTATFAAAGCGNSAPKSEQTDLSNYAHALDSEFAKSVGIAVTNEYGDINTLTKMNWKNFSFLNGSFVKVTEPSTSGSDTKYTLYDVENNKAVETGNLNIDDQYTSGITYYILTKSRTTDPSTGATTTTYKYLSPTGTQLGNGVISISSQGSAQLPAMTRVGTNCYVKGEEGTFDVYKFTVYNAQLQATDYFYAYDQTADGIVWKSIGSEDYSFTDFTYVHGADLGLEKIEINGKNARYPNLVSDGYYYTMDTDGSSGYAANSSLTFYDKTGNKTGNVTIENGSVIATIGNYIYYIEQEAVSADATSGYNVEYAAGSYSNFVSKMNWNIYRYDYVNGAGSAEKIETNYVLGNVYPLYNYSTNKFDKLYAVAYEKKDGVAIMSSPATATKKLVLDENLKVSVDLTGNSINPQGMYKLSDTRYLSGNTLYNENFEAIAQMPSSSVAVWENAKLIVARSSSTTCFVDYDGKIEYVVGSSYTLYKDVVVTSNAVYSSANYNGKSIEDIISYNQSNGETVSSLGGGVLLYKKTPVKTGDSITGYSYTIYDITGKQLGKVDNCSTYSNVSATSCGDKYIVTVNGVNTTEGGTESVYYIAG